MSNNRSKNARRDNIFPNSEEILTFRMAVIVVARMAVIVVAMVIVLLINIFADGMTPDRTAINTLKQNSQKAISNDAGLDVINSMTSEHSVSTAELLDELRVDLFTSDSVDKDLIERIGVLIDEDEKSDPFNVLNEEQKYLFENIRIKSGEHYPEIENDVNRIVTSLKERNDLVTRYLAASESSARLAWFAAILAIISVIPILVNMSASTSYHIQSLYRWVRGRFTQVDKDADDSGKLAGTDESTKS